MVFNMILTVALIGSAVVLINVLLILAVYRRFSREKQAFIAVLQSYFEPHGEDPSEFSKVINIVTDQFGVKMAQSLKSTFMGVQSVDAKNTARIEGAITKDAVSAGSPLLGVAMQSFPALAKLIAKNPALAGQAQTILAGLGNPGSMPGNGDNRAEAAPQYQDY
ncbi:hypothetical protein LCGC14_1615900 [marine sediment metagenome]|uniref:Uncharacterized protein n=1 Tax=marine sediment metagenome TaxID=412755 RepID=A0A0F9L6V8_9ZZZZ